MKRSRAECQRESWGTWRITLAAGAPREALRELLPRLDGPDASLELVKGNRLREVLRTQLAPGLRVYVKRDHCYRWSDRLTWWPRRSRVRQEFDGLLRVRAWGLAAPEPLAIAERRRGRGLERGVLVTREVPESQELSERIEDERHWLEEIGRIARRLHDEGAWHRDVHPGNFVVSGDQLLMIDLQKLRVLPMPVPAALRARDLAPLARDAASRRLLLAGYRCQDPDFDSRLGRLHERWRRARLRTRGLRCVTDSSGFRQERDGALRIYRRTDFESDALRRVLESAGQRERAKLEDVLGGPPPGPAPNPFARGFASPESGAPARAAVAVRRFGGACWGLPGSGMRGWRSAHAALVRGFETPAPLALVEERRLGRVAQAWLLTRAEPLVPATAVLGVQEALKRAERLLEAMHEEGLWLHAQACTLDSFALRPDDPQLVLVEPSALRVARRVGARTRAENRRALAASADSGASSERRESVTRSAGGAIVAGMDAPPLPEAGTARILDRALELLRAATPEPGRLADVPCGTGYLAVKAAQQGWKVTPIDLDTTRWQGGDVAEPLAADLNQPLRLPDESFDAIACCEGLEHVENPWHVLREFTRLLRPDGVLVLSIPNTLDLRQRFRILRRGYPSHYYPQVQDHINLLGTFALCHALLNHGYRIEAVRSAKSYAGPLFGTIARLLPIPRSSGLPEPVRRMLSQPEVLCGRTTVLQGRRVAPATRAT